MTYTPDDFETFHGGYGDLPDLRASSSLPAQGKNAYGPEKLTDDSPFTAWVEGASGDGVGEWIEFTFGSMEAGWTCAQSLTLVNGYQKTPATFRENGRIQALDLQINGAPGGRLRLDDRVGEQIFPLEARRGDRVRLTIASVYPGTKYTDTALSEAWVGCAP